MGHRSCQAPAGTQAIDKGQACTNAVAWSSLGRSASVTERPPQPPPETPAASLGRERPVISDLVTGFRQPQTWNSVFGSKAASSAWPRVHAFFTTTLNSASWAWVCPSADHFDELTPTSRSIHPRLKKFRSIDNNATSVSVVAHPLPASSSTTELLIVIARPVPFPRPSLDPCSSCTNRWPQVESPGDIQSASSSVISDLSTITNNPRLPVPTLFNLLRPSGSMPSSSASRRFFRRHMR